MGKKADALLETLPDVITIEDLLAVQAAYIEEDGDISAADHHHLSMIANDPAEAGEKLEEARAAYFEGSPPEREDEEGEPFI